MHFRGLFPQRDFVPRAQCTGTHGKTPTGMTIRELYHTFADFFPNRDFFAGSSLYTVSLTSPEGAVKLRWAGGGGGEQSPVMHVKE
jgi:hypothetical protein